MIVLRPIGMTKALLSVHTQAFALLLMRSSSPLDMSVARVSVSKLPVVLRDFHLRLYLSR